MTTPSALRAAVAMLITTAETGLRGRLLAASLLVVAGAAVTALAPVALKGLIDVLTVPGAAGSAAPGLIAWWGGGYLLALGATRLLNELRPLLIGAAEQRLQAALTRRFFEHLLALPLAFHTQRSPSELSHSLQQAIAGCQLIVTHLTNSLLASAVELIVVITVLSHLGHPALVLLFVLTTLAYLAVYRNALAALSASSREVTRATRSVYAHLGDSLLNIEAIRCFTAERSSRRTLQAMSQDLQTQWARLRSRRAGMAAAIGAIYLACIAACLTLAAQGVMQGTLSIGAFVLTNVYILQMVRPVETLGAAARDVSHALEMLRPALDILRRPVEPEFDEQLPTTQPVPSTAPSVTFRHVRFSYEPGRPVLQDLDLHIPPGAHIGVVGISGAGKSSLGRLLLRLYEPQVGRVLLDGTALSRYDRQALRRQIAVVPQDIVLLHGSIAANIGLGREGATQADIESAAQLACLHAFIQSLPDGYETLVGERGLKLSGGERQRVAIARAVLQRPRVFVFDESTSMLDSSTEADVLRKLRTASAGCTSITIAHRLSTVAALDEIVVLQDGRIVQRGRHSALRRCEGPYARLWRQQVHTAESAESADAFTGSGQGHSAV